MLKKTRHLYLCAFKFGISICYQMDHSQNYRDPESVGEFKDVDDAFCLL